MRRISTKIALPLLLGLASLVAVACGEENPDPDGEGGSGGGSSDIGDGGGEPSTGGSSVDGAGGTNTDGTGGGSEAEGGNGGEGTGGGSGGTLIDPGKDNELPDCEDEPNETVSGGPIDGEDCWDFTVCEGADTPHFLNQCSGTCIEPFDNEARIDGYTGTLPPL